VLGSSLPKVPSSTQISLLTFTGCNIAINYANSADRAEKFVKELKSTFPKLKFTVIQADVGIKSSCEKLIEETISQLGGLDVIISNAGAVKIIIYAYCRMDSILSVRRFGFPRGSVGNVLSILG